MIPSNSTAARPKIMYFWRVSRWDIDEISRRAESVNPINSVACPSHNHTHIQMMVDLLSNGCTHTKSEHPRTVAYLRSGRFYFFSVSSQFTSDFHAHFFGFSYCSMSIGDHLVLAPYPVGENDHQLHQTVKRETKK
jgi:hypothetical protein